MVVPGRADLHVLDLGTCIRYPAARRSHAALSWRSIPRLSKANTSFPPVTPEVSGHRPLADITVAWIKQLERPGAEAKWTMLRRATHPTSVPRPESARLMKGLLGDYAGAPQGIRLARTTIAHLRRAKDEICHNAAGIVQKSPCRRGSRLSPAMSTDSILRVAIRRRLRSDLA